MWLPLTAKSCKNLREVMLCRAHCILTEPWALLIVWVWGWQIMGQSGIDSSLHELSGVGFEQENALHVYGPVTSAVGAKHLQSPKYAVCTLVNSQLSCGHVGLPQHGLENCCRIRRAAGFRELSQPGLLQAQVSLSSCFWEAVLSPLWIKACCLSLVNTSVWHQCKEEEGLGRLKATAHILACDTGQTNSAWKMAAPRHCCVTLSSCRRTLPHIQGVYCTL